MYQKLYPTFLILFITLSSGYAAQDVRYDSPPAAQTRRLGFYHFLSAHQHEIPAINVNQIQEHNRTHLQTILNNILMDDRDQNPIRQRRVHQITPEDTRYDHRNNVQIPPRTDLHIVTPQETNVQPATFTSRMHQLTPERIDF